MDPVTASVAIILGKYALDKGVELGKEVGPSALATAKEIFVLAMEKLRGQPSGEVIADNFQSDPQTWEKPVEKELDSAVSGDEILKQTLAALVATFDTQAQAYAQAAGTTYTSVTVTGDRNVTAGGSMSGNTIITGDNSNVNRDE